MDKIHFIYDGVSLHKVFPDPNDRSTVTGLIEDFLKEHDNIFHYREASAGKPEDKSDLKDRPLFDISSYKNGPTYYTPRFVGYLLLGDTPDQEGTMLVSLPKYLYHAPPWKETDLTARILYTDFLWQLFQKYHEFLKEDDPLYANCVRGESNLLRRAFQMLQKYQRYGIYTCRERQQSFTKGRIDWSSTVKRSTPVLIGGVPIYQKPYRKHDSLEENLVSQIQRTLVNGCLPWYDIPRPSCNLPYDEVLREESYLQALKREQQIVNRDSDKEIINSMIRFIEGERLVQGHPFYAVSNFEVLFEYILGDLFGNQIGGPLPSMKEINKQGQTIGWFKPDGTSFDCSNYKNGSSTRDSVIFDTAYVFQNDCYILDAKYKRWSQDGKTADNLPKQNEDIYKQYYYAEVMRNYSQNTEAAGKRFSDICNCFVLPQIDESGFLITKLAESRKGSEKIHLLLLNTTKAIRLLLRNAPVDVNQNRAALKAVCAAREKR